MTTPLLENIRIMSIVMSRMRTHDYHLYGTTVLTAISIKGICFAYYCDKCPFRIDESVPCILADDFGRYHLLKRAAARGFGTKTTGTPGAAAPDTKAVDDMNEITDMENT